MNGLKYYVLPTVYEVRWAEFTEKLLKHVLLSWHCLILFLREAQKIKNDEIDAKVHLKFLLNLQNIQLIAFLADVFFLFKNLQKNLQSDSLNIISLQNFLDNFNAHITDMKDGKKYLGGKEEKLEVDLVHEINADNNVSQIKLFDIVLDTSEYERRGQANKKRALDVIRNRVIEEITKSMSKRFSSENDMKKILMPFVNFDRVETDISQIHALLASDVSLALLNMQFKDMCSMTGIKTKTLPELLIYLTKNRNMNEEVLLAFSRLVAATPHSADVERSISANNLLKTSLRNSLDLKTENNYLFVHFNLPALFDWSPYNAVVHWIHKKSRRKHNLNIEDEAKKTKNQLYFKGIFAQENSVSNDNNNNNNVDFDYMNNANVNDRSSPSDVFVNNGGDNEFVYEEHPNKRVRLN